ncbi:MAG: GNAT family N-acetyltransferase [Bacteroidota bacterium]
MIRVATLGDRDDLTNMWRALQTEQAGFDERFRPAADGAERWRNEVADWIRSDAHRLLVAEIDGRRVGFLAAGPWHAPPVYEPAFEVYISEIYVQPEHRRRGLARALVEAAQAWANGLGGVRLRLGVLANNAPALAFWARLGARPFATELTLDAQQPTEATPPTKAL